MPLPLPKPTLAPKKEVIDFLHRFAREFRPQ